MELGLLGRLVEERLGRWVVEQLGQVGCMNISRLTFRNYYSCDRFMFDFHVLCFELEI